MSEATLREALRRFDERNATDPQRVEHGGRSWPREELYGHRMSEWLERLEPAASPELRLAARAQHLARHETPRTDHPPGRRGYLAWRSACKKRHARLAGEILADLAFPQPTIERVRDLIEKRRLQQDPECQCLEDVACLVFLEDHLASFAAGQDEEKLVSILRKTWKKMSPRAHERALELALAPRLRQLVERALEEEG